MHYQNKALRTIEPSNRRQVMFANQDKAQDISRQDHLEKRDEVDKQSPRRGSAKRGYNIHWQRFRKQFLRRNPLCALCGKIATVVHHIVPLSEQGSHCDDANSLPVCASCHKRVERMDRERVVYYK